MNICVISMENRIGTFLYKIGHMNHLKYCESNGYTYCEVNDFSKYGKRCAGQYYKFCVIHDVMMRNSDVDWYMWVDMDAFFTNFGKKIEDCIPDDEKTQICIAKDCDGGRWKLYDEGWNNGVFLMRNTELVRNFCNECGSDWIYELVNVLMSQRLSGCWDQACMTLLNKIGAYKDILQLIPAKSINCKWNTHYQGNGWKKGDFILHFAGMKNFFREQHLDEIGYNLETGEVGVK